MPIFILPNSNIMTHFIKQLTIWGFLILILQGIISCESKNDPAPNNQDTTTSITFHFDHTVDGAGVVFNDIRYENEAGNKYSIMTLKYYISDITLHRYKGEEVKIDTFLYRDIDNSDTRSLLIENIPNGEYTYISFIFGFSPEKNVSFSLPPTQENINMEWPDPMGGGYHYMKLEGRFIKSDGETGSYNTHTGRLQTMDGNINENYIEVELPFSSINIHNDNWEVNVVMNINEWYAHPHTYNIETFGPAIMGSQDAQQTLKENGKNVFTVRSISRK